MTELNVNEAPNLEKLLGMLTSEEKEKHHKSHKISFAEAKSKPEFWSVTVFTFCRLVIGAGAIYLAFNASETPQLALPALLTLASWLSDYFDGTYARKHGVCTNFGVILDHGFADTVMAINTIAIPILLLTK